MQPRHALPLPNVFRATLIGLLSMIFPGCAEDTQPGLAQLPALREVPKPAAGPDGNPAPERRVRTQPTVPANYKEIPFVETAPAPTLTPVETKRGFLLFHRPFTAPVYPNTRPRADERLTALAAFAAPGEFEPLTFAVYPARDLKNFRVQLSPLTCAEQNQSIPAAAIDLRLVTCWNIGYPSYTSRDSYRRTPELLEKVTVHSTPAQECQRYWLTVQVPADQPPGLYRGVITVWDDASPAAVQIPIALRVLPFKLQADPHKHFSAYYYLRNPVSFKGRDEKFIDQATANEYRAMVDHGLTMLPTFALESPDGKSIELQHPEELARMLQAGLQGPLPVTADRVIRKFYTAAVPGAKVAQHWDIPQLPPDDLYPRLTAAFKAFAADCKAKGWPPIVCCPMDEVSAHRADFGARVFAAVKAAGIRTYATKDPLAADAAHYRDAIDVWCSQPFSAAYASITAQTRYEYWSYPNHNAGEIKDPVTMCLGGRMTYGFGLWRSGYTTLIPWHWSWTPPADPFDYLRGQRSGCGVRIDDDGVVIPAVYWECFREGIDDGRYLYTLQAAVQARENNADPACRALVNQSRQLLDATWADIHVQTRYLAADLWADEEFDARRWQLALRIQQLAQFPVPAAAAGQTSAPSVLVTQPTAATAVAAAPEPDPQTLAERLTVNDLADDWRNWQNGTTEGKTEITEKAARNPGRGLRWTVDIDHRQDGDNALEGKYPIGWPRLARGFEPGSLDITGYDRLVFWIRIDSNRDEVADDRTPVTVMVRSHKTKLKFQQTFDFADRQRVWIPVAVAVSDILQQTGGESAPWTDVSQIQLFLSESSYPDRAHLVFDLAGIALQRYKLPTLGVVTAARLAVLPAAFYTVDFEVLGTQAYRPGSHTIRATILDSRDTPLAAVTQDLAQPPHLAVDTAKLAPGRCRLQLKILDADGKVCSQTESPVQFLPGPLYDR